MRGLFAAFALAAVVSAAAAASDELNLPNPKAILDHAEKSIEKGVDKAVDAALAWNKTILVDAALHTSKTNPCKTGYLADAAGKCTVCDFTLSMVPGCNACVEPGTCSGCGEGYNFVAAADSPNNLTSGTCICETAHLADPNCAQCTIAGSCDQCYNGFFPDPATKVCTQCSANCRVCDSATACNVCAEGFSLNENKQCVACKPGCLECEDGAGGTNTCLRCKQGLYPNPDNAGECIAPAVANCLQVSETSAGECAVCAESYSLSANKERCTACKSGCLECDDGVLGRNVCRRCLQGFYPNSLNPGACILPINPATTDNCLQLSEASAQLCAVCQPKYVLQPVTRQCIACPANCAQCRFVIGTGAVCEVNITAT